MSAHNERAVIVVDDDEDIRDSLAALLRRRGYTVCPFANGRAALDYLEAGGGAAVVLLDLMMPVMSGWELRRALLVDPRLRSIPVVVISSAAYDDPSLAADAQLMKPVDLPRLYALVAKHCSPEHGA